MQSHWNHVLEKQFTHKKKADNMLKMKITVNISLHIRFHSKFLKLTNNLYLSLTYIFIKRWKEATADLKSKEGKNLLSYTSMNTHFHVPMFSSSSVNTHSTLLDVVPCIVCILFYIFPHIQQFLIFLLQVKKYY
jgi:hypothetical protein